MLRLLLCMLCMLRTACNSHACSSWACMCIVLCIALPYTCVHAPMHTRTPLAGQ